MPDSAAEQRRALEALINRQVDGIAGQRGWDLGFQAQQALQSSWAPAADTGVAYEFATGWDGTNTVIYFLFDISQFGGTDTMA